MRSCRRASVGFDTNATATDFQVLFRPADASTRAAVTLFLRAKGLGCCRVKRRTGLRKFEWRARSSALIQVQETHEISRPLVVPITGLPCPSKGHRPWQINRAEAGSHP
eukprot:969407-Pyramimonas_sp.AAC.1